MIHLNTDYQVLKKEMLSLQDEIYHQISSTTYFSYVQQYRTFLFLLSLCDTDFSTQKIPRNITIMGEEKSNQLLKKYHKNFLENKSFHLSMLFSFYFDMQDMLADFYESSYYQHLISNYYPLINTKAGEDVDLLVQFFNEEDVELRDIFLDLLKKDRFYQLSPDIDEMGITLFSTLKNTCHVFIRLRKPTVDYLGTFAHELGHVNDFFDCQRRLSPQQQDTYCLKSPYIEVLSTMYQQKFYDFLLGNDIRKDEALLATMDYFYNYMRCVEDAILFSLLPDQFHYDALNKPYMKSDFFRLIDQKPSFSKEDYVPSFYSSLCYSYGMILANHMIENKKLQNQFSDCRAGYFDAQKLVGIGITPDTTNQKILKHFRQYI